MSTPQVEAQGQAQYAYLASLGRGLPEQLLAQGMLMPNGSHLFPAGQYKNCNCKKAKCLKLYCVCFQAGVYCNGCSCTDCQNLQVNDELITRERNRIVQREGPQAFGRKNAIQAAGVHLKGCRCSRSKCAKKYCECYDYQVPCSEMCKCKDCKNPKNKDIGMPRFAVTAAQQQQLLMAMQQKQLGGDAMEVDAAGLLQMQLMQQQGQIRVEDLSSVGAPPVHPDTLPASRPGSRPKLQPNSRPHSPAVPQQAMMQPVLQQLSSLQPPKRRPSAAEQASSSSRLQRLLQPPAARHSLATATPPLSQGTADTAAELASGVQDIAHTAGLQLLKQYGQWLQMPTNTAGLSALAAAASEEQTMTSIPKQHFLAAPGMGAASQAAAAPAAGMEVKLRCASEQPVVAEPGTMSNSSSREQSLESRSTSVGAATPGLVAKQLEKPSSPGVDSRRDVSPQPSTEPGDAATAAAIHMPLEHRLKHGVKMEPDIGAQSALTADDSSTELQKSLPLGQNCRGIAPGKGMQSRHFPLLGALVTAAGRSQQKDLPMQMHCAASLAAAKPLQQGMEQQMPTVQQRGVGPAADFFTNPKSAVTAAMHQRSSEQAVAASMPVQQQQQQLLAAVSSYMQQVPYVSTALPATAGNAWTLESTERQHHQPYGLGIPTAFATDNFSTMQSVSSVSAAAAADRSNRQDLVHAAAAELGPAAIEAEDGLCSEGFEVAKLLHNPAAAAELARAVGLDEIAADAAKQAAGFLQILLKLHVGGPESIAAAEIVVEQQQLVLQTLPAGQQQLLAFHRIRHPPAPLMAGASGPQLAVLTDRPLAAVQAAAGSSRLSPALHALQQQHLAAANSPMSGAAIAATAPMPPIAGMYVGIHGHPQGLAHSIGGVTCTPSPVTAHAYRPYGNMRGPSPLGPVNNLRAREGGLQALIGPEKQHLQQQQQHTPTAAPSAPPGPPGSGTSSAMPSSARCRMPLLPGSFRIAGNINSPAISHGSPAQLADAAALSNLAGFRCEQQRVDSPAGSVSLATPGAGLGQPDQQHDADAETPATGTAVNEHTPVFTNSHKSSTDKQQQQQQQQGSLQLAEQVGPHQDQNAAATATATAAAGVSPVADFSMPPPSSVGAHTPLTECEIAAQMAAAAARIVSAPTPGLWQTQAATSVLNEEQSTEPDPVAAILGSFNGHGWPSLAGMTPAGLELASGSVRSVLAGLTSPFDPASFLSSPLPHMTSVLRDAASGGASGLRALGLRFNDMTPVLLNLQRQGGESSTGTSTGAQRRGTASKGTSGVKALCAGWAQGGAAAAAAGSAAAAAAEMGAADDAPASGRKLDTDKAAARAAAAAVESTHDGAGLGSGGYDAGMSSLIAAANLVSTPEYNDEVPAKRQKQDVVAEPPPEHRQADQQQPQLQQQSEPLPGAAAASWAVFQELDTKSAADSTADKALAAAGVVDGPPDPAGKNFSFTAQARRILLPQRGIGCSTQQESCVAYSSQQEAEQQLCSSDWGSQVPGGEPVPVEPAASQLSQQRQQQQQNMGASLVVGMQQQQEQLAAQHMQQWGSLQLTHQAVHSSTRSEVLESAAGHKPQQRQQAPLNGLMLRGMPANTAAADKVFGRPKNWAADKASKHFHQADDAVAAMSSPHRPPAAVVGVDHDHQELNMTSPPVNAKPPLAQVTADRSPSVDYHEYADAMLQLSRAV